MSTQQANPQAEKTIDAINKLASDLEPKVQWTTDWPALFGSIEECVDGFLNTQLAEVPDNKIKDLISLIKARRDKLSLSSGITSQIVGICQQVLGFGAAGVALTVGFIDKIRQFSVVVQKLLAIIAARGASGGFSARLTT